MPVILSIGCPIMILCGITLCYEDSSRELGAWLIIIAMILLLLILVPIYTAL